MSPRFKDSRQEIKAWLFDELIAACELIDALDKAEQEARDIAEQRLAEERERGS